jgi:ankyrin repeat protein
MFGIRFRWVFCQLDTLRQCLPSSVRQTLEELPESLDETYERIVTSIKKANKGQAYRMLQCLAVAIRPLSVAELAELLAFEFDAAKGGIPNLNAGWRWEDHEQAVLATCSSLITIVPATFGSPVVHFSHFSVKEFLMSDRLSMSTKDISRYHIVLEDANTLVARACLGVLLRDPVDEIGVSTAPLARYAAERWVTHAKVKNVASRIRDGMESLFDPVRPYFSAWVRLHDVHSVIYTGTGVELEIQPGAEPLYYAAYCGFHEIVEHLALKYPQYANAIGGGAGTALHTASHAGHVEVVRSLLKCGVDVDARGRWGRSPLQSAIQGHLNVVQCLLDHGADANFQDDDHMTPLALAALRGQLEIVRVLLGQNVDVNSQCKDGLTPMHYIFLYGNSEGDYPQVVRLLLEDGADPNVQDNKRRTPLHLMYVSEDSSELEVLSSKGWPSPWRREVARILSEYGADIEAEDEEGRTPFSELMQFVGITFVSSEHNVVS